MYNVRIEKKHNRLNPQACYPERREPEEKAADRLGARAVWLFYHRWRTGARGLRSVVDLVEQAARALNLRGDTDVKHAAAQLQQQFRKYGFRDDLVAQSFALVREAAGRMLGMRHFGTQLMAGWTLLNGTAAELATGEGKTLSATLPACTAALAGMPVHIITVNDYLVSRDADWMQPVYQALGLTVGKIMQGMDIPARQAAYRCNVTFCNNKELVFDYLKDRIVLGNSTYRAHLELENLYRKDARADRLLLRGLYFAIVDEADSVLIDEARTPLIISGESHGGHREDVYRQALALAAVLEKGMDFTVDESDHAVRLTDHGKGSLEKHTLPLKGLWLSRKNREELVTKALLATHRFFRDKNYLVVDGKVQIIDEYTGRVMPDRSWEGGLHQMIEMKEGCELTKHRETVARITYQRFFSRYLRLSGMTGTAQEVAGELWSVYRLKLVKIPPYRPSRRQYLATRVHATAADKWAAVVDHVGRLHRQEQRPILVGTRSVEASEYLSSLFARAGLPHEVLNARQDGQEAEIISKAGEVGRITIATNMAGRGTDIKLGPGVDEIGGLHVVLTEKHDARRIDRQLFGRCARQGDRGSCIAIISLEDELVAPYLNRLPGLLGGPALKQLFGRLQICAAQRAAEHLHARIRHNTLESDKKLDKMLAFTGRVE